MRKILVLVGAEDIENPPTMVKNEILHAYGLQVIDSNASKKKKKKRGVNVEAENDEDGVIVEPPSKRPKKQNPKQVREQTPEEVTELPDEEIDFDQEEEELDMEEFPEWNSAWDIL